jgi:excisionase family DNA binding protein
MDTVLKVSDVARLLRVHPTTVYRLLKANGLPGIKLGSDWRFSQEAIERWMKENSERFEQSWFRNTAQRTIDNDLEPSWLGVSLGFSLAEQVGDPMKAR